MESADAAGILSFDRGRGAALADFNLDGLLDLVEVNLGAPVKLWRNIGVVATAPSRRGRWATGSAFQLAAAGGRTATRSAPGSRSRSATTTMRRELTVGGGHISGQLGWTHFGLGPAPRADVRVQWPDGETGPMAARAANTSRSSTVARGRPGPGRHPATDRGGTDRWPRRDSPRSTCRISGRAVAAPELPPELYARGWSSSVSAPIERGYDRLVVYADREHSANLAFLTGFDPRFEEALLVVGPDGAPAILVGNECWGMAGAAPLPMRRAPVPGPEPAKPTAGPIAAARRDPCATRASGRGAGGRRRLEDLRAIRRRWTRPPTSSTSCAARRRDGAVENATDILIDAADGLRVINEVDQLAVFEHAACRTSSGVRNVLRGLRPGHDRAGGGRAARLGRDAAVVPPDADRRAAGTIRPAQPGRPADRARGSLHGRVRDMGRAQLPSRVRGRGRVRVAGRDPGLRAASRRAVLRGGRGVVRRPPRRPDWRCPPGDRRPTPRRPVLRDLPQPRSPDPPRRMGELADLRRARPSSSAQGWRSRSTSSPQPEPTTSPRTSRTVSPWRTKPCGTPSPPATRQRGRGSRPGGCS